MKVYVYALFDAEKPDEMKYVGQTGNLVTRTEAHQSGRDQATWEWVRAVLARNGVVSVKVLQTCEDRAVANQAERDWVGKFPNLLNKNLNRVPAFNVPTDELISLRELESRYVDWAKRAFKNDAQFLIGALGMNAATMRRYCDEKEIEKYWKDHEWGHEVEEVESSKPDDAIAANHGEIPLSL